MFNLNLMKEAVLKSLMRLFAVVSQVHSVDDVITARKVIEDYLKLIVRNDMVRQFLIMYDFYHTGMREREIRTGDKQLSLLSVKAVVICEKANLYLTKEQKLFLLTHILEILSVTDSRKNEDVDFVKTIASALRIDERLFNECLAFIFEEYEKVSRVDNILVVSNEFSDGKYRNIWRERFNGKLMFMFIESMNVCLFKLINGNGDVFLNDKKLELKSTYVFNKGGIVKCATLGVLYYNNIIKLFLHKSNSEKVVFSANNACYKFPDMVYGLQPFSFVEEEAQVIGIMGGSGVGKSTLVNILNGNQLPYSGEVLINGYNVHTEKDKIEGLIGYVPQDDLLVEELTVFQNLYFNAQLCFKGLSKDQLLRKVNRVLHDLGLQTVKHRRVGSPLKKLLSGGQRKRLNIALELIREPYILFVDEPTSGLSSTDSDKVMDLLKMQALRGSLIFVNIHQPSDETFKQLDKLILLDKGGRFVFHGNPHDSLYYLKTYNEFVNADEGECPTCGNLNPDQILEILEKKRVNEFGEYVDERQVSPEAWYKNYSITQKKEVSSSIKMKTRLPKIDFEVPSGFMQFKTFGIRNLLTKIADKQFALINLLEAPILAFILSWFTKYFDETVGGEHVYVFSKNINIPVYIFMGVVVSIFLGLMISAEDIIRDRKLLKREAFLNLSWISYLNSKIVLLAVILGVQVLLFVAIGNSLLEIKGMFFSYWLIFWLAAMFAAIVGLNVSATLQSVVSIYILIPILLVPQILLGGALISFDKLNKRLANSEHVPIVGDIMPSRWAYEALMVCQFKENKYQKLLYHQQQQISEASFRLNYYIPELVNQLQELKQIAQGKQPVAGVTTKINRMNRELTNLSNTVVGCSSSKANLGEDFGVSSFAQSEALIECARLKYISVLSEAIATEDDLLSNLEQQLNGRKNLFKLKNEYFNENLADIVLNKHDHKKLVVTSESIIRKAEPIFLYPKNAFGRAHFYAPVKRIGSFYIDTYWFNALVLVLMISLFYVFLIYRVFYRVGQFVNMRKIQKNLEKTKKRVSIILQPLKKIVIRKSN